MKTSICISREYGSGGREIGQLLAQKLDYHFYDSKLVDLAAEKGSLTHKNAVEADEQAINPWLYTPMYTGMYSDILVNTEPEKMFKLQSEIIREKAQEENCIFVGRSADAILEDEEINLISIYIYAPLDWRITRLMETEDYKNQRDTLVAIRKKDKQRKNYYNYYTGREYADPVNYDLCINSSILGIWNTAEVLSEYVKYRLKIQ